MARSGFATRSIGRRISDASPTSTESNGCALSSPMNSRMAVPALPMSSVTPGALEPAQSDAVDDDFTRAGTLHVHAEVRHGAHRRQAILAFEETGDVRPAFRQRPEHHGAVRDRLVARDGDFPGHALGGRHDVRAHR